MRAVAAGLLLGLLLQLGMWYDNYNNRMIMGLPTMYAAR